jgi:hypothetical protein
MPLLTIARSGGAIATASALTERKVARPGTVTRLTPACYWTRWSRDHGNPQWFHGLWWWDWDLSVARNVDRGAAPTP